MTCKEWIEVILSISSFVCALVSIVIVIMTIKQNNKMLEESTRPVIAVYSTRTSTGNMQTGYLVVRNYGSSPAIIRKFDYDFKPTYLTDNAEIQDPDFNKIDWLKKLEGDVIAPGQNEICYLDFTQIKAPVKFDIEYESFAGKYYKEGYTIDLTAGSMLKLEYTPNDEKKALKSISLLMQEVIKRQL